MSTATPADQRESGQKDWKLSDFDYEVPAHADRFGYAIGGTAAVGFVLLILTGIIMAFFYSPSIAEAHESVARLGSSAAGLWLRSFHRWAAETVTFLVILHMTRVIFTGSYRGKRRMNWIFGVLLLIVTVGFVFSGTILRWDQEGYEAYQHALEALELTPLIGGALASVFNGTLAIMRTLALHALVLPVLLGLFLVPHLALMKLNGLSPLPGDSSGQKSSFFHHMKRVMAFSMVIYGLVAFLAAQFPVELLPGPYTGVELTKPPWFFLSLYALENWIGLYALLIAPPLIVIGLIAVPYIDRGGAIDSPVRKVIVWAYSVFVAVVLFLIIYVAVTPPVEHL